MVKLNSSRPPSTAPDSSNHHASLSPAPNEGGTTEPFKDQVPSDTIEALPDDDLPSDLESIPIDEGIIQIPLDDEDYSTSSNYSEEEKDSDSDNDTELSFEEDRKSTRLNSSHSGESRMPSSA